MRAARRHRLAARHAADDDGASAIEYGLLVAAVAAVVLLAVFAVGRISQSAFTESCSTIQAGLEDTTVACDP